MDPSFVSHGRLPTFPLTLQLRCQNKKAWILSEVIQVVVTDEERIAGRPRSRTDGSKSVRVPCEDQELREVPTCGAIDFLRIKQAGSEVIVDPHRDIQAECVWAV